MGLHTVKNTPKIRCWVSSGPSLQSTRPGFSLPQRSVCNGTTWSIQRKSSSACSAAAHLSPKALCHHITAKSHALCLFLNLTLQAPLGFLLLPENILGSEKLSYRQPAGKPSMFVP